MALFCPRCERQYEARDLEPGGSFQCACGGVVRAGPRETMRRFARLADRLCRMILSSATSDLDIAVERSRLRTLALSLFPDRIDVYDMIYESRFDRLSEQFRAAEGEG